MTNAQQIENVVKAYIRAIETQNETDFRSIWSASPDCTLISITTQYHGLESIYQDFLIGGIQAAYSEIKLIAESIEIHEISAGLAVVVFQYHTECIRRNTGEPYGIQGLETQVIIKEDGQWKLLHVHYSK